MPTSPRSRVRPWWVRRPRSAALLLAGCLVGASVGPGLAGSDAPIGSLDARLDEAVLAATLDASFDPELARRWVAEHIALDQGSGVLRGALGAFLMRTGTDADRALLLASMLERSGVPARLATCTLTESAVGEAAAPQAPASGPGPSLISTLEDVETVVAAIEDPEVRSAVRTVAALRLSAQESSASQAAWLASALPADEIGALTMGPRSTVADGMVTHRTHVWPQMSWGSEWRDLDPATDDGRAPCEPTTVGASVPPALMHHVRIALEVETLRGGELVTSTPLDVDLPTADVATSAISFGFGESAGLIERPPLGAGSLAAYTPILLIDGRVVTGSAIELPAPSSLAGAVGAGAGAAGDVLDTGSSPSPQDEPEPVTGAWLIVELIEPDGTTISVRSEVFDRIGAVGRSAGSDSGFEVAPLEDAGGEHPELEALWQVGLLLGASRAEEAALDGVIDLTTVTGLSAYLDGWLRVFPSVYQDLGGSPDGPIVLLAGLTTGMTEDGQLVDRVLLDAAHVPGVAPADAAAAARDAAAVVAAESFLVSLLGTDVDGQVSVGDVFDAARDAAIPLLTLRPGDVPAVEGATAEALWRMEQRLGAGQALVVPASVVMVGSQPKLAWWSINPVSGLVRDEDEHGRHSVATEEGVVQRPVPTWAERFRRMTCRLAGPVAIAASVLYVGSGGQVGGDLAKAVVKVVQTTEENRKKGASIACAGGAGAGG